MNASDRVDDAARAGWLYYVAGRTQDEIARQMGISRQAAQRLVSLAVTERLIRVSVDHPIAHCLDLGRELRDRFGLKQVEVAPTDPGGEDGVVGLAEAAADEMVRWLRRPIPTVMAVGTGRTLKAVIQYLPRLKCPQHRIVSLTGAIGLDGSVAYYNVIYSMADLIEARHFPMPLPVFLSSAEERRAMLAQPLVRATVELAAVADVAFVGVGEMDDSAPLLLDGYLSHAELTDLRAAGAVGEICGWIYDAEGRLFDHDRVASPPLPPRERAVVFAIAKGRKKLPALRAAVRGGLVNALITDEATADALLAEGDG